MENQQAEEASVDLILDLAAQRLRDARLTFEHATSTALYYRVGGDIRIRISDCEPDDAERMWELEHSWPSCVRREYLVAPAIGDELEEAERVVAEILDDLRGIE